MASTLSMPDSYNWFHVMIVFFQDILSVADANVFGVDWRRTHCAEFFMTAAKVPAVGAFVGHFVSKLHLDKNLDLDLVTLVGYSTGAHAFGHTGRTVTQETGKKVGKISGLEPNKPYFDMQDESLRINKEDGQLVEIVHTNSDNLVVVSSN